MVYTTRPSWVPAPRQSCRVLKPALQQDVTQRSWAGVGVQGTAPETDEKNH